MADNSCPVDSVLVKVTFEDGPLGVSLRRRPDGTVFVSSIVKGSQADGLDIQETDDLWGIGPTIIGNTHLDKEAWDKFINYVKFARRPLDMIFKRKKATMNISTSKSAEENVEVEDEEEDNDNDNEQEDNDDNDNNEVNNDNVNEDDDVTENVEEETVQEDNEEEVEIRLHDRDIQELKQLASKLAFKKEIKGISNIFTHLNSTKNILTNQKNTLVDNSASQMASANGGSVSKFLVKEGRQFIKEGSLVVISNQMFKWNAEDKRQFYLFTDILIIAVPLSNSDTFQIESVLDLQICKIDLGKYVTDSLPVDGEVENISINPAQLVFDIISPFGIVKVLTSSPEEKDLWTMVLCAAILNRVGSNENVLGWKHHYVLGTMHSAVINRDEAKVAELIQLCESGLQDFSTIEESDDDGYTPLHYASILRAHGIVKILHEASADVTTRDRNGFSPLHWAALQLDDITLTMLSSHIFDTDLEDNHGRTPLFLACVEGRDISGKTEIESLKRCLSCLISLQANTDVKDKNNISALQYLAASWQYEALKLLLDDKVDPNYASGKYSFSALHYAATAMPLKKAKGEASKVLLNFKDDEDLKKTEELNFRGGIMTLKALLQAGAKPNYRDSRGKTVLQLIGENSDAWASDLSEAVGVLLSYGARLDESAQVSILRSKCPDINFETIIEEWVKDQNVNADTVGIPINGLANTSSTTPVQHADGKERCLLCSTQFTLFRRQHHCRLCGILCCDDCSKKRASVQNELVRSCDTCFNIVHNKVTQVKNRVLLNSMKPRSTPSPTQQSEYSRQKSSEQASRFDLFSGAKTTTSDDKKKDVHSNMAGTMSELSETKQRLNERGEKLNRLQDKTADLSNAASDFAKLAKQLNQKSKNSWF